MRVFVSHTFADKGFCDTLAQGMRGAGADVWYDDQNLGAGHLRRVISHELASRPAFIVVLSKAAFASEWVQDECEWAYNLYKREPNRIILPVTAQPIEPRDFNALLFIESFARIEAPGYQPYPLPEAVTRTLRMLALTPAGGSPESTAPRADEQPADLLARGKALLARGQPAEAAPLFERASQLMPGSFEIWYNLAYTLDEVGRFADALAASERALALETGNAIAWNNKALALVNLNRPDEALAAYDRALALDANSRLAWFNKGSALYAFRRYAEAMTAFDQALALDDRYAAAWNGRAYVLRDMGRADEGLRCVERAIGLAASEGNFWDSKGDMLMVLGQPQDALAAYEQALRLAPNVAVTWRNKAAALRAVGRAAEAAQAEAQARALEG
jgi:tetratricopeptide (TPR) repeat protein